MGSAEEKLQHFKDVILTDAWREVDAINQEIESESKEVMSAADDEALTEAFRYIKAEIAHIEADCGRRLSHAVMANKREIFLRREAMADEVMAAVQERLEAFTQTPGYAAYLETVLAKLLKSFDRDVTVCLRPEDRHFSETLTKLPTRHTVTFFDGTFSLGGLEVYCTQRNRHADATFDTRMLELREHFSEMFGLKVEE
ncbi:MAG: hypothetical protein LBI19_08335 [Oscillospiraceae bacterium]|jgi:vacuolar-type H+-ATPase subunit E/Vma4|nr:hypothetical protein [Oscillospiraceae bacterium]